MAGPSVTRAAPTPGSPSTVSREQPASVRALLRSTAGWVLVASVLLKVLAALVDGVLQRSPALLVALDTAASFGVVGAVGYVLWRKLAIVPQRLLWRVRRKLILSYVFIGAVPAALIVVFVLLGGLLLSSYVGSYLISTELDRLNEEAATVARATALEMQSSATGDDRAILARHQAELSRLSPAASMALVPAVSGCDDGGARLPIADASSVVTAGPWAHLAPPQTIPPWVGCDGTVDLVAYAVGDSAVTADARTRANSGGQLAIRVTASATRSAQLLVRAVAWTPSTAPRIAVVVDVPIDGPVRDRIFERTTVHLAAIAVTDDTHALPGRAEGEAWPVVAAAGPDVPFESVRFLDYRDWLTGERAAASASLRMGIGSLYVRIAAAQGEVGGRSLGQILVYGLLVVGALFLLIQCAAVVVGLALARSITGSVHALFAGTARVRQGDFSHRINVEARDQLGELAESFNTMTASVEALLLEAGEKKRLEEELRIAHEIQMSLLPKAPVSVPGLSLSALCVPAREVGGDYYDFLPLSDGRLGLLIADVAGKGTSAALYMAELKGLVLSLSLTCDSPRALLITANRLIAKHLRASSFITMTYAVVDRRAGTMTYARAGHTPLLCALAPANGCPRLVQVLAPDGLVLGLNLDDGEMFERLLEEQTVTLSPGDVYVFYTDGITEAMNAADDCFGEHRLVRLIEDHADLTSGELQACVLRNVEEFVAGAPQHDDMTMLLLKVDEISATDRLVEPRDVVVTGQGQWPS